MVQTSYGKIAEEAQKLITEMDALQKQAHKLTADLQARGDQKSVDALKEAIKNNM